MVAVVGMQGNSDLVKVILAFRPIGRFAGFLYRWQKKSDQDANNRNHNK